MAIILTTEQAALCRMALLHFNAEPPEWLGGDKAATETLMDVNGLINDLAGRMGEKRGFVG